MWLPRYYLYQTCMLSMPCTGGWGGANRFSVTTHLMLCVMSSWSFFLLPKCSKVVGPNPIFRHGDLCVLIVLLPPSKTTVKQGRSGWPKKWANPGLTVNFDATISLYIWNGCKIRSFKVDWLLQVWFHELWPLWASVNTTVRKDAYYEPHGITVMVYN